ncbi:Deacetoxyvindoline 4-hydroxylase [Bertholletia excelsa]
MSTIAATTNYDRMKEVKEFDDSKLGAKGLSDSGITTIPKFFVHSPETLSGIKSTSKEAEIPVIDISGKDSPELRPNIVKLIHQAAATWGFFQVINHGVPIEVLNKTLKAVKSFHDLPLEVRSKHYVRQEHKGVAYTSNTDLFRSKAASWHDYVQVWMSPEPVDTEQIPAACREELLAWDGHATAVAQTVAELLAEGLGLPARRLISEGLLISRLIAGVYYPYCPQPELTLGLNHHTDPGMLTVLLENKVAGLQVKHGGEWVDVKPVPGSLIINIGDSLQIISNGEYRSVEHRVLANSLKEPRISVVEFFNVDKRDESGLLGPLPELITPEKPAVYRSCTFKELHENFYSKGLGSKSMPDKLML